VVLKPSKSLLTLLPAIVRQWREIQISTNQQIPPEKRTGGIKEINGVKYGEDEFFGVKVLLPV